MKIIFTVSFNKLLSGFPMITEEDIIELIKRYPNSNNLVTIDNIDVSKIIKWYLFSKKIRILILLQTVKWKFIPVSIVKKETFRWKNITKENYQQLFGSDIDKAIGDIDHGKYTETLF